MHALLAYMLFYEVAFLCTVTVKERVQSRATLFFSFLSQIQRVEEKQKKDFAANIDDDGIGSSIIFYNGNFLCEFVLARIPIIENQRAFVAPADIQSFTSEAKNKLSTRLQGKTRYFGQAVKEICATFEEMQKQKASGLTDETDDSRIGSEAPSNDEVVGNHKDEIDTVLSNAEKDNIDMNNVGSNLEHCTQRVGEKDSADEKNSVPVHPNESSLVSSPGMKSKLSMGSEPKKNANKLILKGASNFNDFGQDDNGHIILTNGTKPRKLVNGLPNHICLMPLPNLCTLDGKLSAVYKWAKEYLGLTLTSVASKRSKPHPENVSCSTFPLQDLHMKEPVSQTSSNESSKGKRRKLQEILNSSKKNHNEVVSSSSKKKQNEVVPNSSKKKQNEVISQVPQTSGGTHTNHDTHSKMKINLLQSSFANGKKGINSIGTKIDTKMVRHELTISRKGDPKSSKVSSVTNSRYLSFLQEHELLDVSSDSMSTSSSSDSEVA
ncbi:unnamed protein product [Sphenostylis stenocarpa]|uniref:Uncharacterized protein n=1 Tax=Sphenostylis stenocarpa TaxID=92480 RepID=A0AA86RY65_9FABA|nr:unnamed protein product [Sphenostylis stenocarpa]